MVCQISGKAGITLNINWYQGKDDSIANADAAERAMQFLGGWFANPIYGSGDYPGIMRLKVKPLLFEILGFCINVCVVPGGQQKRPARISRVQVAHFH